MNKTAYDGNTVVAWDKCDWMPKELIAPTRPMKLSDAVRECGYLEMSNVYECVLARAYRRASGRDIVDDIVPGAQDSLKNRAFLRVASSFFGVPYKVADEAETRCMEKQSKDVIADWLQEQGY